MKVDRWYNTQHIKNKSIVNEILHYQVVIDLDFVLGSFSLNFTVYGCILSFDSNDCDVHWFNLF